MMNKNVVLHVVAIEIRKPSCKLVYRTIPEYDLKLMNVIEVISRTITKLVPNSFSLLASIEKLKLIK